MSIKALFFVEGISYGHIVRAFIISQWLRKLDINPLIVCPENYGSLFKKHCFEIENLTITPPGEIYQRLRQGDSMYLSENLLNYFAEDDSLIQKIKPDLIISEFRFTALQLAKKYQIPAVGITEATCHPAFINNLGTVPDSLAKPEFIPLWLLDFIALKTPIGKIINQKTIQTISQPYQQASTTYGVEILANFFEYASQGDICLISDHPDLIPLNHLRSGDIYTGALLWERDEALPTELSQLNPHQKIVYISLGTQDSLATDFLTAYLNKLLAQDIQVILSLGKRNLTISSQPNLWVFDFINDSKLLPLVDLLVYPGGAMTTYQAIAKGVPLLALPSHANQHFYAEAIAQQKLGYCLRPSRLKIDQLVAKTVSLLNIPRQPLREFQAKLSEFNHQEEILQKIEKLIR
ncbi:MAG: hypothetical protein EA365_14820 [Gloeocapsa sp. DLM2.Bin57]|nr:MAG: hypothetical protein EA365_14820 [Gloeocapsa sp. DLM2.Bin57]